MEFERVFIIGLTQNEWEKGGKAALIPSPIDMKRTLDDVIRQFYVALTRAKDEIVLSYAKETGDGKERMPSLLIPSGLPLIDVSYEPLPLMHSTQSASELVCALTKTYLTEEGLSPSALKEYLESPACFFAKRVLRLREPESNAIAIGNSVHEGIAAFLKDRDEAAAQAALERSLKGSLLPRNAAFEHLAKDARERLRTYIDHNGTLTEAVAIEKTYTLKRAIAGEEVLLRGKVDAVFATANGECIIDFKTSSSIRAHDEEYRHQLAFYDLLLRANDHAPMSAMIVQVGADEVVEHDVPLSEETRTEFLALLDAVIQELLSGQWRKGEPTLYDDVLRLFS
jgi:ATP-dependent helicase/DNAse subunit B